MYGKTQLAARDSLVGHSDASKMCISSLEIVAIGRSRCLSSALPIA
jgi:hypothetical protein